MKNIILILGILLASLSAIAQKKEKTYKVLASCGQCQFDMNSKSGCTLAIQYAGKKYWVDGTTIHDHGDEHSEEGFCQATRKAEVKGTFDGDKFHATSFVLLSDKKKNKKK